MATPFIGEIRMFGGNFAPRDWALCDGQLLSISANTALFSILGTTYGGDGRTTFALPDMRGRLAVHPGSGPGLTTRRLGERSGVENVALNATQIPSHNHSLTSGRIQVGAEGKGVTPQSVAQDNYLGDLAGAYRDAGGGVNLNTASVTGNSGNTGNSQSHNNMMPFECVNYIIALLGTYPSRN